MTAAPLTNDQILDICKRIDDAKNGKGPMPEVVEMRAALDQIRVNRRAGAVTGKKSKTPSAPVNLDALFNP